MKPYYRAATVEDALYVAKNLQLADKDEMEGMGHQPMMLPFYILASDVAVAFCDSDDTIAGVAGITNDPRPGVGIVWMMSTPDLSRKPHTFVRQAKLWLREQHEYSMLWNYCDARNTFHHKLLRLLGFKALKTVNIGPKFLPYLEIVKLCV
jgi:hypothetical protein|tara:strand:- start:2460 stop:2912 length:453 start_codon:yes stop_codon:yes gene_type:complete